MVICFNHSSFFFLINYIIELRHAYVAIFISGQVFPCQGACSSKSRKVFLSVSIGFGKQGWKKGSGSQICSLPQSYASSWLGQCHIVILILDIFSATGSGITHLSLSELDLFGKCSQSLSLFQGISNFRCNFWQSCCRGLNINTSINYGPASAKIFSLASFLYPDIK